MPHAAPRIDSHQHFWRLARGDYGWLTPALAPLHQDFEPADLLPLLNARGIVATVAVQAAETDAETDFLLAMARGTPWIGGVVGWTDLVAPTAPDRIDALAAQPKLVGMRPMLQDLADDDFVLRPSVRPALSAMERTGLRLDALVRPRHLPRLVALRNQHPGLPIVIDHCAKPLFDRDAFGTWATDLRAVASDGLTCCKLSGLVTEAGPGWTVDMLRPVFETVLDAFGPERLMWGSDWPVLNLAAEYEQWADATDRLLAGLPPSAREAILGGTATRFYGLKV
jgi:L-fuconolactonase